MELIQYSAIPTYLILQNFEKQMVPWKIQYYQRAFVWMVPPQDFIHMHSDSRVRNISITVYKILAISHGRFNNETQSLSSEALLGYNKTATCHLALK